MNVNIGISRFEILTYFVKSIFLTMGYSDGEGQSQLYLQLIFMPQKVLSNIEENEKNF